MLTIRLQRLGKAKKPSYRLVINENAQDTQAIALEILGHYAPTQQPKVLELKRERIEYWLSKGAQTSETVHNLLVKEGIIKADKRKSVTITNKRATKLNAKKAEQEEKQKVAETAVIEAKAAEEEAKKQAEEDAKVVATEAEVKIVEKVPTEKKKEDSTPEAEEKSAEEPKKEEDFEEEKK